MIRPAGAPAFPAWAATNAPTGQTAHASRPPLVPDGLAPGRLPVPAIMRHTAVGPAVTLQTSPAAEARIAAGQHQVRTVDGVSLAYPSQDLRAIESAHPFAHGQTHSLAEHVGQDLSDNVRRLQAQPIIHAAGGFLNEGAAQRATDGTIANPANQRAIGAFLADPGRLKTALARVDLGTTVGTSTTRADLDAGRPSLIPGRTATVVLIKDRSFPEGYRVLTTYPDTRPPEVDARGGTLT